MKEKKNVLLICLRIGGILGLIAGILYSIGGLFFDITTTGLNNGTLLAFGALFGMPTIGVGVGLAMGLVIRTVVKTYFKIKN